MKRKQTKPTVLDYFFLGLAGNVQILKLTYCNQGSVCLSLRFMQNIPVKCTGSYVLHNIQIHVEAQSLHFHVNTVH